MNQKSLEVSRSKKSLQGQVGSVTKHLSLGQWVTERIRILASGPAGGLDKSLPVPGLGSQICISPQGEPRAWARSYFNVASSGSWRHFIMASGGLPL